MPWLNIFQNNGFKGIKDTLLIAEFLNPLENSNMYIQNLLHFFQGTYTLQNTVRVTQFQRMKALEARVQIFQVLAIR